MRFLPTRIHGAVDYLWGLALIATPWLFGFATGSAAQWIAVIFGAGAILYSLITDYELGVVRLVPVPVHLALDAGAGLLLTISPWIFGFADETSRIHMSFGLFSVVASLVTQTKPAPRQL
ncbi:SPW repeat domain-containing protein [Methylobacterium oxalidis]|uniref:SPW repeat-containing integral membrane domain-containing protein n=1 Tax=Methylobacterium oxalidis TaxID=944322 RepID=A0A512JD38_9HYPH|nr:SPW repeat protein [Methylobacterium oxalidis]GEP07851.1 hypothetical protein MOX02_58890 [Methylobacterium oxalidis]GJE35149.1 hypothetical protein LDDCCGHA_5367 [Methylobacterium oxalidis]GLS64889.1 hypothetical protein GCM10007888_32700 [Methylobacterium oxalidis]